MSDKDLDVFNRKILIIGIDGATWEIFDKVINETYMPYLNELYKESAYGKISSTFPPISPAAWGTIQTGRNSINNNIYEFYCFNKETKDISIVNSKFLKNTIWEILSNLGKKVAVVNVPMTYPPKSVNGYVVSGILTPSLKSNFTYPPWIREEIVKRIPNYQLNYSEDVRYGNPHYNIKEFVQERIKNIKDRTKVCVWLLKNFKIDILMVNFQANDILQHVLWGYIDENHKLYNERIKNYIFHNFHRKLDFCIETIREEFKRNISGELLTLILSDHGCESHNKQFFLGDFLHRENLLSLKQNHLFMAIRRLLKELYLKFSHSSIQLEILNKIRKFELNIQKKRSSNEQKIVLQDIIDWKHTKAYSMGIGLYGLIFIFQYDVSERLRTISLLSKKLMAIIDPENGEPIVDDIILRENIYQGNNPQLIPDLFIKPKKGYSFTGMFQNVNNLFRKIERKKDFAIGKHCEEGLIIVHGNRVNKQEIKNASLIDIVPSILNYFKIPLMEHLEGKIFECFH